jgi:hypothetical protein
MPLTCLYVGPGRFGTAHDQFMSYCHQAYPVPRVHETALGPPSRLADMAVSARGLAGSAHLADLQSG